MEKVVKNNNKIMSDHDATPSSHLETYQGVDDNEEALLTDLMEKEAKLQKLNKARKQLEKESKHIIQSNTWKMTTPIRKVSNLFQTLFRGSKGKEMAEDNRLLEEQNRLLETELETVHNELIMKQEQLDVMNMESTELDHKYIHKKAKEAKESGNIIPYIHNLVEKKEIIDHHYNEGLKRIGRLYNREKAGYKQVVYSNILTGLKTEDIPEFMVRFAETDKSLSLKDTASFRASLTTRARLRQLNENTPEQMLDHKLDAYRLMDQLEIKRPWVEEEHFSFTNIPREEGIVIKPVNGAGSRGVYLVYHFNIIQDVKQSIILTDWESLEVRMQEDLASGWVAQDEWLVEELIVNNEEEQLPARDIKFYCFYGKVALILEITRYPELSYAWWTPDGERILTGKYDDALFTGEGVTIEEIEDAAFISAQLPTPFIRIDFLKTDQGMVFGEFTPKPGNYDEFDKKTDQWLGDFYLEAEGRLAADLIDGKSFNHYKDWKTKLSEEKQNRTDEVGGRPDGTEQGRMAPTPFE